ncbi:receptor like protein 29-like [Aristolochia californica]|uniref:receptor like protein 29-like n=1 Tax=Aristolochia californica TaxID=171875 RepID=UPI0035E20C37
MFSPPVLFFLLILTLLLCLSLPFTCSSTHEGENHHQAQDLEAVRVNMDPVEKENLLGVMESMSSDRKWRVSNTNPCKPGASWPGLECKLAPDNRLHVYRLDFGTPPNPVCKTTAKFPSQVFELPFLQSVFFFNCFTHAETTISIPAVIRTATSLQQLSLRSNPALVGPIPPQITLLRSLEILTLSQNRLRGRIPPEISTLTSLIHLDLSYNFLAGPIPKQLGSLRSLVGLDLSYNALTGPMPDSLGLMGILQKLDLSSNLLSGPIPNSLENLSALVFLALSSNRFQGFMPGGLPKLQNLQYFIMDDNPMFIPLPSELGKLVKLQEIRLASSGYFGVVPASFSQLVNLTTLSLENNRLTGVIPARLNSLSRIYHLNLSRNMLVGVVPFDSGFLKRLGRNLDLSSNPGLCLNGSEVLESTKLGIGLCGNNNRIGSVLHPLKRSGAPSLFCNIVNFMFSVGIWGFYQNYL